MANVGDSKAALFDDASYKTITEEHKPTNLNEKARVLWVKRLFKRFSISKAGGAILYDRVGGVLSVSRAFGDHSLRNQGVICNPSVSRIELRMIHKWLVVASDGLWDVMSEKDVYDVVKVR